MRRRADGFLKASYNFRQLSGSLLPTGDFGTCARVGVDGGGLLVSGGFIAAIAVVPR